MLLRRITRHMRAQNWPAVLLDFLIVVAGVFIGIEVANLNEGRQQRAEEQRYYAQILQDLRTDIDTLDGAVKRANFHDNAADLVLAALDNKVSKGTDPARLAAAVHYAGYIYIPMASRGTYDELVSTGNLGLLRDPAVKTRLARYYGSFERDRQWDTLLRGQQSEYWSETAGLLPRPVLRAAIRDARLTVTAEEADAIIAEARARPRLAGMLMGMAAHQERIRRDSERYARDARALIADLERRL